MYGKSKNDVYKASKWSEKSKISSDQRSRNDIDLNSESDYEDKTEQSYDKSYDKPVSYNDYFTKLTSTINDIKTDIKNPNQNKLNEKIDTILEYVKSIDSDTKNDFEILGRIEKNTIKSCHCEEIFNIISVQSTAKSESLTPAKSESLTPAKSESLTSVISHVCVPQPNNFDDDNLSNLIKESYRLNTLNNKSRLRMDILPLKLETLSSDVEQLHRDVNVLLNAHQSTNLLLNKLIIDNDGLRNTNLLLHKKLDLLCCDISLNHLHNPIKTQLEIDSIEIDKVQENIEVFEESKEIKKDIEESKEIKKEEIEKNIEEFKNDIEESKEIEKDIEEFKNDIEESKEIKNDIEESKEIQEFKEDDKFKNNEEFDNVEHIEDKEIENEVIQVNVENNLFKSETDVEDISSKYYKITDKPKTVRSVPIKQKNKIKK